MKVIEDKNYYKMSELVSQTALSNHTISFYYKKGLLPNTLSTSVSYTHLRAHET